MAVQHRLVDSVEVTEEKVHIIHLKSVFDASTADEFEQVLRYLMANNYFKFVIDLTKVEFISSAGWGNFVGELQKIRDSKGDLKLSGMSKEVYDVYLLLELDMFIKSYVTIDEALSDFSKNIIGVDDLSLNESPLLEQKSGDIFPEKEKSSRLPAKPDEKDRKLPLFPIDAEPNEQFETAASNMSDHWFEGEGEMELFLDTGPDIEKMASQGEQSASEIIAEAKIATSSEKLFHQEAAPETALKSFEQAPEKKSSQTNIRKTEETQDFDETKKIGLQKSEPRPAHKNGNLSEQDKKNGFEESFEYLNKSKIRPTDLNSDPMLEKIVSVVIANPAYGPSAIRQMLIRLSMADDSLTRSFIYRKLEEVDLSTRAKRIAFAHANSL